MEQGYAEARSAAVLFIRRYAIRCRQPPSEVLPKCFRQPRYRPASPPIRAVVVRGQPYPPAAATAAIARKALKENAKKEAARRNSVCAREGRQ